MNTPAHVIFSLALLGRTRAVRYVLAITAGALIPDLLIILFYGLEKIRGIPERVIWQDHYYDPFWQGLFDVANSIPLIAIALGISFHFRKTVLSMVLASMLIHCFLDFPVHHDDGHRHFYPFSDFRFASPLSYWDPRYYGNIVGIVEIILFVTGCIYLWTAEKTGPVGPARLTTLRMVVLGTVVVYGGFFAYVWTTWMDM